MSSPVMTVFAGVNGSGKSSLTKSMYHILDGVVIDPDQVARDFNLSSPQSARKVLDMVNYCIENRESFSIESTISGKSIFNQIRLAKSNGFKIYMNYVILDSLDLHIARMKRRVSLGGHHIETSDIVRRYSRSQPNLMNNLHLIDELLIWDNSGEEINLCSISSPVHYEIFEYNDVTQQLVSRLTESKGNTNINSFKKE